ncbi:TPM domain-containing protein [Octadecabacter sp.]|nr:TPM domain-containing protein [Octadecabacter sp.]
MRWLFLIFVFLATLAGAQTFPQYQSTLVNDYANLLPPDQEAALAERLESLKAETGVEMTVLTLGAQAAFAPNLTLEQFATGLFDEWGVGHAEKNDGILVLVLRTDRAMRIELGAGYGRDWDLAAGRVVERNFLPAFRNDDYAEGILVGSQAVIDQIVVPFRAGDPSPVRAVEPRKLVTIIVTIVGGSVAMIVGIVMLFKRLIHKLRKCSNCGQGGFNKTRIVTATASTTMSGRGINRFHCDFCGHSEDRAFTISKVRTSSSRSSGGSFGGGRSGGGGASGRW